MALFEILTWFFTIKVVLIYEIVNVLISLSLHVVSRYHFLALWKGISKKVVFNRHLEFFVYIADQLEKLLICCVAIDSLDLYCKIT